MDNQIQRQQEQNQEQDQQIVRPERLKWYRYITVEPTMYLYMMAFMVTSVVEQAFFLYKACKVNHGYSEEICANLEKHTDIKKIVQVTVTNFFQWNSILGHIVPIILALFLGSWSDRRGRKLPLILGLVGKLIYSLMIIVNAYQDNWPVEYIIYTATIPSALTGADVAIFASCFAYISDVSSVKQRTLRVTILDVCYLSTMPTGVALGSFLYTKVLDKSYANMFMVNSSLLALAILYTIVNLKWQTTATQRPIKEVLPFGIIKDFFDKQHVIDSVRTLTKKRNMNRRLYLWIFMIAMALYTFQRDEKLIMYMYTQIKFEWTVADFSLYKVVTSSAYVIVMLFGVPVMSKLLGFRDTIIIMIGASAHAIARLFFVFAENETVFYVGGAVSCLGPVVAPVLRSMTSKSVALNERGKVFALLSVFDNAVPIFSGVLYSQLYTATLKIYPGCFFWLTLLTQALVFALILIIHVTLRDRLLDVPEVEKIGPLIDEHNQQNEQNSIKNSDNIKI